MFIGVRVLSWAFAALIHHSLYAQNRVQRMMNKCSERERIINECSERERIMNECSERERMMNECIFFIKINFLILFIYLIFLFFIFFVYYFLLFSKYNICI